MKSKKPKDEVIAIVNATTGARTKLLVDAATGGLLVRMV